MYVFLDILEAYVFGRTRSPDGIKFPAQWSFIFRFQDFLADHLILKADRMSVSIHEAEFYLELRTWLLWKEKKSTATNVALNKHMEVNVILQHW